MDSSPTPHPSPHHRPPLRAAAIALAAAVLTAGGVTAQVLDSVTPATQSVHGWIVLKGSGFGSFQPGSSAVLFDDGSRAVPAGTPYVWRDDFIRVRVPAGDADGPIPKEALEVLVVTGATLSNPLPFQVITAEGLPLWFRERTSLTGGFDNSPFLGTPDRNIARTKDADIGDVNGDGLPDLIDNNSNNQLNDTHGVLRLNRSGERFAAFDWEPVSATDSGDFVAEVPPGGDFVGDAIVYDADFVDLDNDELPDWVQAAAGSNCRVRVLMNGNGGPGSFLEASETWFPTHDFPCSPDDIAHADVNHDGFVDVAAAFRFTSFAEVYLNQGGTSFGPAIRVTSPLNSSCHDVAFIDADNDGFHDVILGDESGTATLLLHNGDTVNPAWSLSHNFSFTAVAPEPADLNADGWMDLGLASLSNAAVFLNNPAAPGTFQQVPLPNVVDNIYDLEAGDVDLDGHIDLVGAAIIFSGGGDRAARVWLNNGDGTFTNATDPGASDLLPGIGPHQRLSADLIDYDVDGDLDLYLTGADGSGVKGFGQVANQFWENQLFGLALASIGTCPGEITLEITGASPNARVTLFTAAAEGSDTVAAGRCAGTELGLQDAMIQSSFQADANGEVSVTRTFPPAACGLFRQLVDNRDCAVSLVSQF